LIVILGSAFPYLNSVNNKAEVPPAAEASIVFKAIIDKAGSEASNVLPALNANHPKNSRNAPAEAKGILLGAKTLAPPSELKRPVLGPRRQAIANAAKPPIA